MCVSLLLILASQKWADEMARKTVPSVVAELPPDDEGKHAYLVLYMIIVRCIKNRPLPPSMETVSRDGREALRKLDVE